MEDRRMFHRFNIRLPVSFLRVAEGKNGVGETWDISAKGIGMRTYVALEPRSRLDLRLKIPDRKEPLFMKGQVVWSSRESEGDYRVGINLDRPHLTSLASILNS
jgi:hypothetical protein